ncbi:JmjC domain-containing protein [Streptacidiphilus rugosus]|uniref:JmjC domain-containing protein n=1 Tax=Streptacidiphilus rugosus TaxID=405783 RepID=UPI00055FE420|nr:cupin domain-containing protein [Streptacidiphilus rugosus]
MEAWGLPDTFIEDHWRRAPLHLPGAARRFLPDPPSRQSIFDAIGSGADHQTDGSTVWFLEGLTDGFPGFPELVGAARRHFEWHDVWCDVFATRGPSTIGSHYDGSDNFTIQLTGNKQWFLSPPTPDRIHPDDRRRRLLGEPALGRATVSSTEVQMFEVKAGDVLYIPSTWVHWGFSDGDSTSVSLVVNVASALHALEEVLMDGLRHEERWWRPLPVGPGSTAVRNRLLERLATEDLPTPLRDPVRARIVEREGSRVVAKPRARAAAGPTAGPAPDTATDATPALPEPPPGGADLPAFAIRARRERNLHALRARCAERATRTTDSDALRVYGVVADVLSSPSASTLELLAPLLGDPELCSWLAVAERELPVAFPRQEDPLGHFLGALVLPELVALRDRSDPLVVRVPLDEDGGLELRRLGLRLAGDFGAAGRVSLGLWDGVPCAFLPGGPRVLEPGHGTASGGLSVTRLPWAGEREGRRAVVTTAVSDWLRRDPEADPRALGAAVPAAELPARLERLASAWAALDPVDDAFLSWILLREGVPTSACGGTTRLVVAGDEDPIRLTAALRAARARQEIETLLRLQPVFAPDQLSVPERRAARAALVEARLGTADAVLDPGVRTGLTAWGRLIADWVTASAAV